MTRSTPLEIPDTSPNAVRPGRCRSFGPGGQLQKREFGAAVSAGTCVAKLLYPPCGPLQDAHRTRRPPLPYR